MRGCDIPLASRQAFNQRKGKSAESAGRARLSGGAEGNTLSSLGSYSALALSYLIVNYIALFKISKFALTGFLFYFPEVIFYEKKQSDNRQCGYDCAG